MKRFLLANLFAFSTIASADAITQMSCRPADADRAHEMSVRFDNDVDAGIISATHFVAHFGIKIAQEHFEVEPTGDATVTYRDLATRGQRFSLVYSNRMGDFRQSEGGLVSFDAELKLHGKATAMVCEYQLPNPTQ